MNRTGTMTALTVEELQAAFDAARRGVFAAPRRGHMNLEDLGSGKEYEATGIGGSPLLDAGEKATPTVLSRRTDADRFTYRTAATSAPWLVSGQVIAVLAAHAGAGCSVVAVAIAEALTADGIQTRLIDVSDPNRSGLAAATTVELGVTAAGWRRGRHGRLRIDRVADRVGTLADLHPPLPDDPSVAERVVLDLGQVNLTTVVAADWLEAHVAAAHIVLVCRPTVPAVRQAEHILAALDPATVVLIASPGNPRWPGAVTASCGPAMRQAREAGRVVPVPIDRHLAVDGVTGDPLPKSISAAGRAITAHLTADQPARD